MLACLKGRDKVVKLLIVSGADVQVKDKVAFLAHVCTCRAVKHFNFLERRNMPELHRNSEKSGCSWANSERVSETGSISGCGIIGKQLKEAGLDIALGILIKMGILTFLLPTATDRKLGVPLYLLPASVELLPLLSCSWSMVPTQMEMWVNKVCHSLSLNVLCRKGIVLWWKQVPKVIWVWSMHCYDTALM